jgi:hypothetical protein
MSDDLVNRLLAISGGKYGLTSGPGGIMEMKQTIADKEKEIERLQRDLLLVVEYDSNLLNNLRMRRYGSI